MSSEFGKVQISIQDTIKFFSSSAIVTFMFPFYRWLWGVVKTDAQSSLQMFTHRFIRKFAPHNHTVRRRNLPGAWAQREKAGLFMQMCYIVTLIHPYFTSYLRTVQVCVFPNWCGIVTELEGKRFWIFLNKRKKKSPQIGGNVSFWKKKSQVSILFKYTTACFRVLNWS